MEGRVQARRVGDPSAIMPKVEPGWWMGYASWISIWEQRWRTFYTTFFLFFYSEIGYPLLSTTWIKHGYSEMKQVVYQDIHVCAVGTMWLRAAWRKYGKRKEGKAFENGVRGVEGQGRAPEGQARRLQRPVWWEHVKKRENLTRGRFLILMLRRRLGSSSNRFSFLLFTPAD